MPDIVQNVFFVAGGTQISALNSALGQLRFWNVETLKQIGAIDLPRYETFDETGAVISVASADGTTLAIKTAPTTVLVVDVATHAVTHTLKLPRWSLTDLALSPDGSELALLDDFTTLLVVDSTTGKDETPLVRARRDLRVAARGVSFDPSGTRLAIAETTASKVQLLDSASLEPLGPKWVVPDDQHPLRLAWSSDGSRLAVTTMVYAGGRAETGATRVIEVGMLTWRAQLCAIAS